VRVVTETSPVLGVDGLSTTGLTVHPVNPQVADARRKPCGAKTDQLDAAIWARLGWQEADPVQPLRPADETGVELRPWTRVDAALTVEHARLVNERSAVLKSYDPVVLPLFDAPRRRVRPGPRSAECGPWSRHGQPGKPIGARFESRWRSF
jgi:hypothetical protein